MALNIEAGINITYTDEIETYHLFKGDEVICHVGEKRYTGRITFIGEHRDTPDTGFYPVIYIDTSRSGTSFSGELIKISDITYICKSPFADDEKPYKNRENLIDSLIQQGFSREKAEKICVRLNDVAILYNASLLKSPVYASKAIAQIDNAGLSEKAMKDVIMDHARECCAVTIKEYLTLIDIFLKDIGKEGKDARRFSDAVHIVSKCWDDLMEQDRDDIARLAAEIGR